MIGTPPATGCEGRQCRGALHPGLLIERARRQHAAVDGTDVATPEQLADVRGHGGEPAAVQAQEHGEAADDEHDRLRPPGKRHGDVWKKRAARRARCDRRMPRSARTLAAVPSWRPMNLAALALDGHHAGQDGLSHSSGPRLSGGGAAAGPARRRRHRPGWVGAVSPLSPCAPSDLFAHLLRRARLLQDDHPRASFVVAVRHVLERALSLRDRCRDGQVSVHGLAVADAVINTEKGPIHFTVAILF